MKLRVDESGRECCTCGLYKEWSCFNKGTNHGHDSRCRDCMAAYRRTPEYRNRNRIRNRLHFAIPEEREKQNERVRAYRANPEVIARLNTEEAKQARSEYGKTYWKEHGKERLKNLPPDEKKKFLERASKNMRKFLANPRNRLSNRMAAGVKRLLRGQKNGRTWESLVGYTIDDLRAHLEKLFEPDMTWENYGKNGWHVDHIVPMTAFSFESYDDPQFRKCWALKNLMPRWCTTEIAIAHGSRVTGNINKGNRWKFYREE